MAFAAGAGGGGFGKGAGAATNGGGLVGSIGGGIPGRCFVTGVPADFTATDFQLYFQQYGDIADVFVPSGGKGIAYVSFADPQVAQSVIEQREHRSSQARQSAWSRPSTA